MSESQPAANNPHNGTIPYHQVYFGCCNRTVMTREDVAQPKYCPFCGKPMSEGKQEARDHCDFCFAPERFTPADDRGMHQSKLTLSYFPCPFAKPQEKAQPESQQDVDERNAYTGAQENAHKILRKVYSNLYTPVEQAAFQRGQQAMAEKAAQVAEQHHPCSRHKIAADIRSLAIAEPPQGEAEKEGRT